MKRPILIILAIVMIVASVTYAACDVDEKDSVIRLNEVTHSIFYAPLYAAINLGYFEEAGIELELINGGGADKTLTALLANEADIGLCGCEAAIYVNLQGHKNAPVVFGQLTKRDGSFLVGRTAEPNFDYSNLEGKTVIMGRRGGMPAMTLQYVLNQNGYIDGENITMDYSVQFNLLAPAFVSGTGDYVTLFEPTASALARDNGMYIVSSIGEVSGELPYTCFIASPEFLKDNAETAESFLRCIKKATDYLMETDEAIAAQYLAPHFDGTSTEDIIAALKSYKSVDSWMTTPSMKPETFERFQDIMENAGELESRTLFEEIVDNTIADRITA